MALNFLRSRGWRIATPLIMGGLYLLAHYAKEQHQDPPTPPAVTEEQAYDQICGHPDACAALAKIVQDAKALEREAEAPSAPPPAAPAADSASSSTGQPGSDSGAR
jgi:hypothetical protein